MSTYKIKVSVELVECKNGEEQDLTEISDGSFEMKISEKDAISKNKRGQVFILDKQDEGL